MHIINNPENLVLYDRNSEIHKAFNVLQDNMYMCFEITLKKMIMDTMHDVFNHAISINSEKKNII